jgi:hypothetical protein
VSYDDKNFLALGFRVRHKYARRPGRLSKCVLCGVKRRQRSGGWEYLLPDATWTTSNPPCARKMLVVETAPMTSEAVRARAGALEGAARRCDQLAMLWDRCVSDHVRAATARQCAVEIRALQAAKSEELVRCGHCGAEIQADPLSHRCVQQPQPLCGVVVRWDGRLDSPERKP